MTDTEWLYTKHETNRLTGGFGDRIIDQECKTTINLSHESYKRLPCDSIEPCVVYSIIV